VTRLPRPGPDQRRTLVRVRDLSAFRSALVDLALSGGPLACRRRTMVLPTRASIELLRQSIEAAADRAGRPSVILPDLVTRDDWMASLHGALSNPPPLLTRTAREILLARAARLVATRSRMPGQPFHLRPGLVAEVLRFYDALRLRQRSVRRFARALFDELKVERGTDRGSESLIHQTAFLGFTFLAYERGVAASGALDEHALRRRLVEVQPALPFDHVVVAVADRSSDLRGLWPADFDLLGRLHGIAVVDVVMTEETHDAGFRERLERELPGIEERAVSGDAGASKRTGPILVTPRDAAAGSPAPALCHVSRDREEELRDVVRAIRRRAEDTDRVLEPTAVVFQRPLPYLYLAEQVLADAGVPFQAFDALPLASEPYSALLDLVLTMARTGGTREATVALLRSTLARFEVDGEPISLRDAAALDAVLRERRASGEADTYVDEVTAWFGGRPTRDGFDSVRAGRAARAARAAHAALAPFRAGTAASAQVATVAAFLRSHQPPVSADDPASERSRRARAAVLGVLDSLADAFARYDDAPRPHDAITAAIHHAVESQTFAPRRGRSGVHLVDAVAARFGEFAHVHLVGLVETDWPERAPSSMLYTSGLLKPLGWPQSGEHAKAEQAAFRDLLGLAAGTVHLHAFQLEGDSVVALSPILDAARRLPSREEPAVMRRRIFSDELLTATPEIPLAAGTAMGDWLPARAARPPLSRPDYSGAVDPQAPQSYRVSRVDRYVECPFKYFAESVLGLPEEREEMSGLTPLERGNLIHKLFERFYQAWQQDGLGAITAATLPEALARFTRLTHEALAGLPEADRALEETRLLGSIVARGIAERVFELEVDEGGEIVDRLLEYDLRGPFPFPVLGGMAQKTIAIRGKADRIDVFDDGALRIIDYKLSRLPDIKTSQQIAVYAHCAAIALEARDGQPYTVSSADYLAFGEEEKSRVGFNSRKGPAAEAIQARVAEFAATVQHIESGEFPAKPIRTDLCRWCRYAGVCRKEYRVAVEDDAAEPV
jgi:RecB family exonuclease